MGSTTTQERGVSRRGRPREFDIDQVVDAAVHAFCTRGFHGTSISDLAAATGLTTGSLYKAFADKDAIYLAALHRQSEQRNRQLGEAVEAAGSGREKVRALLEFYAELSQGECGSEGCLIVETAVDIDAVDARAAEFASRALEKRREALLGLIELGQADGSIPRATSAEAVSTTILYLTQGMRVIGKTRPRPEAVASVVASAMTLLD